VLCFSVAVKRDIGVPVDVGVSVVWVPVMYQSTLVYQWFEYQLCTSRRWCISGLSTSYVPVDVGVSEVCQSFEYQLCTIRRWCISGLGTSYVPVDVSVSVV